MDAVYPKGDDGWGEDPGPRRRAAASEGTRFDPEDDLAGDALIDQLGGDEDEDDDDYEDDEDAVRWATDAADDPDDASGLEDDEEPDAAPASRRALGGALAAGARASRRRAAEVDETDQGDEGDDGSPRRARRVGPRGAADEMLDELLPERLDWERLVREYPIPALIVAAVGGFLLGRYKGFAVVTALSTFAADAVADNVNDILGDELL